MKTNTPGAKRGVLDSGGILCKIKLHKAARSHGQAIDVSYIAELPEQTECKIRSSPVNQGADGDM